ncbi:MAG: DUF421 domain-containing protein [Opitutaceae bacterium]
MEAVLRATAVYGFLLLVFRVFGKRSLAQITTFDFVLLLIVAETTQQASWGDDFSVTNSFVLVAALFVLDFVLSRMKDRWPWFERVAESVPLVIVKDGEPLDERMRTSGIDIGDVLAAARENQGLDRLDQIKYAVLEKNGGITIVPREK